MVNEGFSCSEGKRGSVLIIVAIVLGVLAILILGVGVYLYNFHVFKEVRLCLGEPEDTGYQCSNVQECFDKADELQIEYNVSELPSFARDKLEMLAEEGVYCEGTCKIKKVRGINLETYELGELESCNEGEGEILIKIRGKEGIQIC